MDKRVQDYAFEQLQVVGNGGFDSVLLTNGKSGAEVYRAKIVSKVHNVSGIYIIKIIDKNSRWHSADRNEAERYQNFFTNAPQYHARMVELVAQKELDDCLIVIYRQANDSVLNSAMLEELNPADKVKYLKLISYELLEKMSGEIRSSVDASSFFHSILDYRIIEQGTFYQVIEQYLDMPLASSFSVGDSIFPNPAYYIRNQDEWITHSRKLMLIQGNMHGDLHSQNVICTKDRTLPEELQYSVIDYDSFRTDGYLLFDHAYLELGLYLNLFPDYDFARWEATIAPLIKGSFLTEVPCEFGAVAPGYRNAICDGIARWQKVSFPHAVDVVDIQFCLARIAAGVNYFSKQGITNRGVKEKVLIYLGLCFKELFDKLSFSWDSRNPSTIKDDRAIPNQMSVVWEKCLKNISSYSPILLTDDSCDMEKMEHLTGLSLIDWRFVIDVGEKNAPDDISTILPKKCALRRHVNVRNLNDMSTENADYSDCEWVICKKGGNSYESLWLKRQNEIQKIWRAIRSNNQFKPYFVIFDVKDGKKFADGFLSMMKSNINQLAGSKFVSLRRFFDSEQQEAFREFQCFCENFENVSLVDVANTAQNYFSMQGQEVNPCIILPTLDTISETVLQEKELAFYGSSVEIVYPGMEGSSADYDFGTSFYRGNEIKWRDIANMCDLPLLEDYNDKMQSIQKGLMEGLPRIRRLKLVHGSGSGGTTLSKRILWDLKEITPTMRLRHYTKDTANIILEIYRKTGKVVFLCIEMGSAIISPDELESLVSAVESENGKLWILQVERSRAKENERAEEENKDAFIELKDTLSNKIAKRFYDKFRSMTKSRQREMLLNHITNLNSEDWISQRCPFFYGFYTFEEEYNLENIIRTVQCCDQKTKDLLSDMSLMTIYSQNLGISVYEAAHRLTDEGQEFLQPALILNRLDPAVGKLIVHKERGLRICHTIIAKKIMQEIWNCEQYRDSIFPAASGLIDRMYNYYGEDDNMVDASFRELFIDRAVVDSERMKSSLLIEDIDKFVKKEEIFKRLIRYYPNNPHYLNHLARLKVAKEAADYSDAISFIDQAINISADDGAEIHYITKGCILTKKVFSCMDEIRKEIKTEPDRGRMSLAEVMHQIRDDYDLAESAFMLAQKSGKNDSYAYFPYINLECRLLEKMVGCDRYQRSLMRLYLDDSEFKKYYCEHYGKAVELFEQMKANCGGNTDQLFDSAENMLNAISLEEKEMQAGLRHWMKQEGRDAIYARRTYATALYARNGYSWMKLNLQELEQIEEAMHFNMTQSIRTPLFRDVIFWFESYRRLKSFTPEHAIDVISDYMPDGYDKEFLCFILHFLRLEKGLSTAVDVIKHCNACKSTVPSGVNTSKARMAYSEQMDGCPIISMDCVKRGKFGEFVGLKEFRGTIIELRGSTSAIIRVDTINLDAVFVPSVRMENGQKREFTSRSLHERVKFNLLFSYSGLRAWNVELI